MEWHYANGEDKHGPINEQEYNDLISNGTINDETLVWNETYSDWMKYANVKNLKNESGETCCNECGEEMPANEMICYDNKYICPTCKPIFLQKSQEGIALTGEQQYVGFWLRLGAKFIDGIFIGIVQTVLVLPFAGMTSGGNPNIGMVILSVLIQYSVQFGYNIYMVGKYGATFGKMAIGAKIIMEDGSKVGYGTATGRIFAEILSGLILMIGYIMAAFDDEKRTLHDRVCHTRVVKK